MGNLYCPNCERQLDVVFSEQHKAFLADKQHPIGTILKGEGTDYWKVTSIERHEMGWAPSCP